MAPPNARDGADAYAGYEDWKRWAGDQEISPLERDIFEREFASVPLKPASRVLEVGFGRGVLLDWLRGQGHEVAGTEIQSSLVAAVSKRHPDAMEGSLPELGAAGAIEGPFDMIVAFDVFEHLTIAALKAHLHAIDGLLAPGGYVLARFPNGASPFGRIYQNGDLTHIGALTISSFEQACIGTSLKLVDARNAARPNVGPLRKRLARKALFQCRSAVEGALGALYFSKRIPLDPNLTVIAQKPA